MTPSRFEIRRNDDGTIDEIVADEIASMHVEQMSAGHWWIGLTLRDGREWHLNLFSKRGAAITLSEEQTG